MNIRISSPLEPATAPTAANPRTRRSQRVKVIAGLVGALLLAAILWRTFAGPSEHGPRPGPPPVRVARVEVKDVAGLAHSIGTVVAVSTVQVTALLTGQLLSTGFAEGQIVKPGQVLFQIDPRPFAAALEQARATLARDIALSISAQNDKIRYTNLAAQGAASAQQRDQALATANSDAATVQADRAAVKTAELNLGYTTIHSPIAGKTGPLLIQPGNLVTANNTASPLVTITQLQPIKVSLFLPQSQLPAIQQQMVAKKLTMTLNVGAGAPIVAPVDFIGNQVDAKTGTVELRATFGNTDFRLVPGQFVDAAVSLQHYLHAIVVPREAVNIGPDSLYVFVIDNRKVAGMRPVRLLYDDGTNDVVEGNVRAGEQVVVEGQLRVVPGKPVQVIGTVKPTAAAS